AVADHCNATGRPGERTQIVQHYVESHARRRPVGGRIAQEDRAEIRACHGTHVALDEHLALRVCGLRVYRGCLVEEVTGTGAVDAARRRVDEPADAALPGEPRERDRTGVIDLE